MSWVFALGERVAAAAASTPAHTEVALRIGGKHALIGEKNAEMLPAE
jgi:hypothetical protein